MYESITFFKVSIRFQIFSFVKTGGTFYFYKDNYVNLSKITIIGANTPYGDVRFNSNSHQIYM